MFIHVLDVHAVTTRTTGLNMKSTAQKTYSPECVRQTVTNPCSWQNSNTRKCSVDTDGKELQPGTGMNVMPEKKNLRKKAVADAEVQWTLALRVILHFLLFVCAGAFFGLINQFFKDPFAGLTANVNAFWQQSGPMLLALACLIPIFVRDTLTLSNRIAGPIYRLRDTVKRLGDGEDVPPLKFRKRDMWNDLPELFNKMTDRLRNGASTKDVDVDAVHIPATVSVTTETELVNA